MKQVCLFIGLIISVLSEITAQAKLKSTTYYCNGQKTRAAVTNYEYQDQHTFVTSWSYYTNGRITKPCKAELVYDTKGQKISEKEYYWYDWDPWGVEVEMETDARYSYDAEGCLLEEKTSAGRADETPFQIETVTYKRAKNCQIRESVKAIEYPQNLQNGTIKDEITTYQYDNNDLLIRIDYTFKDSINALNFEKYERLSNGNVKMWLKQSAWNTSTGYETRLEKKVYEYDSKNRLLSETQAYKFTTDTAFAVHNIVSYFYNSRGLLSRTLVNYKANPSKCADSETLYAYDCDDLLREKTIKYVEAAYCQSEFKGKYVYAYTNVAPCETVESDEIAVFPNPTNGLFTIESPTLRSGDWRFKMVDSNGKMRSERSLDARSSAFYIVDEQLSSGIYWLTLTNGKATIHKKLVVVH